MSFDVYDGEREGERGGERGGREQKFVVESKFSLWQTTRGMCVCCLCSLSANVVTIVTIVTCHTGLVPLTKKVKDLSASVKEN